MGHHKPTHPITFRGSGWEYTVQIESPSTPECQKGVQSPVILSEEVISQFLEKINQRCDGKQFDVVNRKCITVLFI